MAVVVLAGTVQTVTHHDRQTAYRVADRGGNAAPLLCVHGSGGTHGIWKSQLARLAGERPVAALDLSGHGDSDCVVAGPDTPGSGPDTLTPTSGPDTLTPTSGPDVLDAYAQDVLAVADEINASVFVGNSLGGAVVLTALLDHGANPDAVVLAGSGAKLAVLDDLRNWLAGENGGFERAIEFLHGDDMLFHDPSDRQLEFSKRAMRECGRGVVERDFLSCHAFDVRDRLDELDCPVFALTGEHDQLTPPGFHEYVAEHVRDGAWTTVEDAAHLSMLETPDAFNDELSAFLDERGC